MRILEVSQNFPNQSYDRGPFIKQSVDSVSSLRSASVEVVAPLAYVLPFRWFPFHKFWNVPLIERTKKYRVHHPRYLNISPPGTFLFYPIMGDIYSWKINSYIKREIKKPDLIHSHVIFPDGYAMQRLSRQWKVPLVVHIRGTIIRRLAFEIPSLRKKLVQTLEHATRIISVSDELAKRCESLGIDSRKIRVVPNGVDTERFRPLDQGSCRKRLGLPNSKRIVLYLGNMRSEKGVKYLAEAIPAVVNEHKETLFLFVGRTGPKKNFDEVSEIIRRNGIKRENIMFVGEKPYGEIHCWINSADLVVIPSLSEGRPNSCLEAMACEKPIVATRVGGIPEIVRDNFNGLLCDPERPDQLGENMLRIMGDKLVLKEFGKNSRRFIFKNRLTWQNHARRIYSVYEEAI